MAPVMGPVLVSTRAMQTASRSLCRIDTKDHPCFSSFFAFPTPLAASFDGALGCRTRSSQVVLILCTTSTRIMQSGVPIWLQRSWRKQALLPAHLVAWGFKLQCLAGNILAAHKGPLLQDTLQALRGLSGLRSPLWILVHALRKQLEHLHASLMILEHPEKYRDTNQ